MDSVFEQMMLDPWGRLVLHYVISNGLTDYLALLLVAGRFVGLFVIAPQLVRCPIPYAIRIAFVVVLSLLVAPVVASEQGLHREIVQLAHQTASQAASSRLAMGLGESVTAEIALGTLIGVSVWTMLSSLKMAGGWLERHAGLSQGSVMNRDWFAGDSAPGHFVQLLGIASLFLLDPVGGQWPLLRSLLNSFQEIPIGTAMNSLPLSRLLSNVLQQSMILGLRLAMPLLVTMSFVDATIALASRIGPPLSTLNFIVVRLIVGVVALALTMTTIPDVMTAAWGEISSVF